MSNVRLQIKEIAQQRGYTIRSLHLATGVAYSTVFRYWHNYIMRPDPTVLKKLAQALQVADWRELIVDDE